SLLPCQAFPRRKPTVRFYFRYSVPVGQPIYVLGCRAVRARAADTVGGVCGRYVTVSSPALLAERFEVTEVRPEELPPCSNVAPRADVPVVAERGGVRVLDVLRWGLVPFWAKDPKIGDRMINARAETLLTSNAFKRAFERRRCIVPADGFYEWEKLGG